MKTGNPQKGQFHVFQSLIFSNELLIFGRVFHFEEACHLHLATYRIEVANGLHALQSRALQTRGCAATRLWRWGATEGGLLAQVRVPGGSLGKFFGQMSNEKNNLAVKGVISRIILHSYMGIIV